MEESLNGGMKWGQQNHVLINGILILSAVSQKSFNTDSRRAAWALECVCVCVITGQSLWHLCFIAINFCDKHYCFIFCLSLGGGRSTVWFYGLSWASVFTRVSVSLRTNMWSNTSDWPQKCMNRSVQIKQ